MAIKNVSIVIYVRAWDTVNNAWKTGDAANITMYTALDGGTPGAISGTVAEVDATNMPGVYKFTASAGELNGNSAMFSGKSSTANIVIVGQSVITEQGTIAVVDGVADAIKDKTDNLPSDPADQSAVEAAITAATSPLATSAALTTVDTVVDAVKAVTDKVDTMIEVV